MKPREKAERGVTLLKEAILEILAETDSGMGNSEIADALNIRSDYQGSNQDYLSWSILGLLLNEKKIDRSDRKYIIRDP